MVEARQTTSNSENKMKAGANSLVGLWRDR
jgi:hypothetical protein